MSGLLSYFSYGFIWRALIGGVLISLCIALLGVNLVLRRFSMIGDGLSHVGFGALALAAVMNVAPLAVAIPLVTLASFFMLWLNERGKMNGDASIAMLSSSALAAGVLLSYHSDAINTDLSGYLFGSILGMKQNDVWVCIVLSTVVLFLYLFLYQNLFSVTFDQNFANATGTRSGVYHMIHALLTSVTIVIGMRLVGALLISSLIIFPTLTAMRVCRSYRGVVLFSACSSVFCFLSGMLLVLLFDLPVGASIVMVSLGCFLLFAALGKLFRRAKN